MELKSHNQGITRHETTMWTSRGAARGRAFIGAVGLLATSMLAACASQADGGEVEIGYFSSLSGPNAQLGKDQLNGLKLAVEEANADGGAGGEKISIKEVDDQADPAKAITAIRSLSGSDILVGGSSTAVCIAAGDTLAQLGKPTLFTPCTGNSLLAKDKRDNAFHIPNTNRSSGYALGLATSKAYPEIKKWHVYGLDYIAGREMWRDFQAGLSAGGTDVETGAEAWTPLTATDVRSDIANLNSKIGDSAGEEGLMLATFGAFTGNFISQGKPYALTDRIGAMAVYGGYDRVAWSLNGTAPTAINAYDYYYAAVDTPMNKAFVEAFNERYGANPSGWAYLGYEAGLIALEALRQTDGSTDPDELIEAISTMEVEVPTGTVKNMPELNQFTNPMIVFESVGDPSAPEGLKILNTERIDAQLDEGYWLTDADR